MAHVIYEAKIQGASNKATTIDAQLIIYEDKFDADALSNTLNRKLIWYLLQKSLKLLLVLLNNALVIRMSVTIKILKEEDWMAWKAIRLEALQLHPEAFGSAYEDESKNPDDDFKHGLGKNTIFGAYNNGVLVGVAGFFILPTPTRNFLCSFG